MCCVCCVVVLGSGFDLTAVVVVAAVGLNLDLAVVG